MGGAGEGRDPRTERDDREGRARHRMGTEMQGQRGSQGSEGRGRGVTGRREEGGLGVQEKERRQRVGGGRENSLTS